MLCNTTQNDFLIYAIIINIERFSGLLGVHKHLKFFVDARIVVYNF